MAESHEGGLWCHEVLALLDRYVDGQLTEAELAQVTAHVGACDNCANFGAAYGRVVASLRSAPEPSSEEQAVLRRLQDHFDWSR